MRYLKETWRSVNLSFTKYKTPKIDENRKILEKYIFYLPSKLKIYLKYMYNLYPTKHK